MSTAQTIAQGSVTLRKLRSGATAQFSLSSTMQLFQLYTYESSGAITPAPDWTGTDYPIVSVNASSNITVTNVQWFIDGTAVGGQTQGSGNISNVANQLHIRANIAGNPNIPANTQSHTLTAIITYNDGQHTATIEKSEMIRIQQAVNDGFYVMLNANRTWVDGSKDPDERAEITAVCYKGLRPQSDITFKWFNGATEVSGSGVNNSKLTVNHTMVNGSQLFICRAYNSANTEVDAEGITIVDNSDTLLIVASVQQKNGGNNSGSAQANATSVNVASDADSSVITFSVVNRDNAQQSGISSWEVTKYHADTMKPISDVTGSTTTTDDKGTAPHVSTSNAKTAEITVYDKDYVSISGGSAHETEVVVTATATL